MDNHKPNKMTELTQSFRVRLTRTQRLFLIKEAELQKKTESKILRTIIDEYISKTNTKQ